MAEKVVLAWDEIEKKLKDLGNDTQEKISFLKPLIRDADYKGVKKKLVDLLVPELKKSPVAQYKIVYDSVGEGLEPIYFWVLDFMRDPRPGGLGLSVFKGPEEFEASVASGYFSEVGTKGTQMQAKAMEYFGAINQVIKSVLNLIYDLKEFEVRIKHYDDLKDPNPETRRNSSNALKGVWMDQVDVKKGKASINLLAQDLGFVTIRDAFFYVETADQLKDLDLNERVKNILRRKFAEYMHWLDASEKEIKKRYEIERAYLKSQYGTLKLYANWLKPYLVAAQKLRMKEFDTPDIVSAFSTMELHLSVVGQREVNPADVHDSFKNVKLDKKYYAVLEASMVFRGVPSAVTVQSGRQYVHGGRSEIQFKAYTFDDLELESVKSKELYEDLEMVNEYVGGSLAQLQEEIDKYINPVVEKPKKPQRPKFENPFKGALEGWKELTKPIQELVEKHKPTGIVESDVRKHAEDSAKGLCFTMYNLYKKLHGMLSTL